MDPTLNKTRQALKITNSSRGKRRTFYSPGVYTYIGFQFPNINVINVNWANISTVYTPRTDLDGNDSHYRSIYKSTYSSCRRSAFAFGNYPKQLLKSLTINIYVSMSSSPGSQAGDFGILHTPTISCASEDEPK